MAFRRFLALLCALLVIANLGGGSLAAAAPLPSPPSPLADVDAFVEGVMADWHLPGMAVGVIQNGQVVLAKGYGERGIDTGLPVTENTVFGIASLTKAFTTATIQSLAEDGTLSWDLPIRDYLPGLRLKDPWVSDRVTARDWASHRTGMPSVDLPFLYRPDIDPAALMTNLNQVDPLYDFRTTYRYSNLGYVVLGEAMRQATGQTWDALVRDRILNPLGMSSTNFGPAGLETAADSALPYALQEGKLVKLPYSDTTSAGPGGAMNSSVADMLKWLSLHLNQGRVDDRQLLSPGGVADLHTIQISKPSASGSFNGYALGWDVEEYGGHLMLSHSGRNPGYGAYISMVPQKGMGVVVLTNLDSSPALFVVANHLMDRLLGMPAFDWNATMKAMSEADLAAMLAPSPTAPLLRDPAVYVGEYIHPVYGTVRIELAGENLQAVYYSTTIPLTHKGFGHFAGPISPETPIDLPFYFETSVKGEITRLLVDFELEGRPVALTRIADPKLRDPEYLKKLVGQYSFMGDVVEITLSGTELSLNLPGQPAFVLLPLGSRFGLKGVPEAYVTFELDEKGEGVVKAVLEQYGYPFEMERMK